MSSTKQFLPSFTLFCLLAVYSSFCCCSTSGARHHHSSEDPDYLHHNHHHHHDHHHLLGRVRRDPKSRQRSAADAECRQGYRERIEHHCRYPSMDRPCFVEQHWQLAVDQAAAQCCKSGLCSVDHFEPLCCRTLECLEKCYGKRFLAAARSRFRYFDILVRPYGGGENEEKGQRGKEQTKAIE